MNTDVISLQEFEQKPLPLLSIIIAQQCVLFPLYFFIPLWIVFLNTACALLVVVAMGNPRIKISRWIRLAITLAAIGGVLINYQKFSGRDAGVALISVMYGLKILETRTRRDASLLLSFGFFMLVAGFLFSQKPWIAFYQFIPIIMILNALVGMQSLEVSQEYHFSIAKVFKDFSKYLLLALPIMLVLFLFFPRLSGPIWRMPGSSSAASGVSDSMSPGAISNLQLFDKVAFRVSFEGQEPNSTQMYWRMLALDNFDGITWTRNGVSAIEDPGTSWLAKNTQSPAYRYSVTLEATQQNYLVAMDRPVETPKQGQLLEDYTTYTPYRLLDRTRYSMTSAPEYKTEKSLTASEKRIYTRLPVGSNSRSLNWAREQRARFQGDPEYINFLLNQINKQAYFYTLSPPIMRQDTVDSFWFDYKKGFCEHYAGAFVFLARAANIPARVVVGYQGGEKNQLSDYWIVRYANAHAWTELWLDGVGWVRIDPTSAIAAHRIDERLLGDYRQRDSLFDDFEFVELDNIGFLKQLEYWSDRFNNRWNDWILDYNNRSQRELFKQWGLSGLNSQQLIIVMFMLVILAALVSSFKWFHYRTKIDPLADAFTSLLTKLDKQKIIPADATIGPLELKKRLLQLNGHHYAPIIRMIEQYIRMRYQNLPADSNEVKGFSKKLKTIPVVNIHSAG